jgi:glycosyltransferase involved in cell wall biosynthesis
VIDRPRALRIALVSEHASPLAVLGGHDAGGQNVHVAALAGALAERGHQVEVYTRREDPHSPPSVALQPGVTVRHVPAGPARPLPKDDLPAYLPAFEDWLTDRWHRHPPDVAHAHFWMSGSVALAAGRAVPAGLPVAQTFHALGAVKRRYQGSRDTSPPQRIGTEARIVHQADAIIATCGDEVHELTLLGADPTRVDVVPCGVDLSRFTPHGPLGGPPRVARHRVLCLSRLVARKGVETVITALAAVPDTELIIAGGPPAGGIATDDNCRRLLAAAHAHGVTDRVRLLGRITRDQAPPLLRSSDVLISVPVYEPFGIVPVEAMACGVPVIVSAVGGMLETVRHGVTGLHVPPANPRRLAESLLTVLHDPVRRAALGRAAADHALGYGWEHVAARTEAIYYRLVMMTARHGRRHVILTGARTAG